MISQITLKFGRSPGAEALVVPVVPITVFVGPNNSGKSKVLAELLRFSGVGRGDVSDVIIGNVEFSGLPQQKVDEAIGHIQQKPNLHEALPIGHILVGGRNGRMQVPEADLRRVIENPHQNLNAFCGWFLRHSSLMLDGRGRINLVDPQAAGDLQQQPQSSLQVLLRNDAKRHEVRRIVYEAFGAHFVVDPTNLGQLRVRLSSRPPRTDMEERGIHAEAVEFHAAAQPIELASDGVKAFTGIVTEVFAGDPRVLMIDEPEAFLHPSLASKLGFEISKAALATDKRVFVSTHSPMFVMGCIQSGAPLNIVRLTYRAGVPTARILPGEEILQLMRHPLLRSINVLNGLFYEFVVVTESDADRAFYQEINERLLEFKPEWGIPNCLFLNAQNKQTIQTLLRPLRKLGIPAAAIVDIDVLKEGGANWTSLLEAANVPEAILQGLATTRAMVMRAVAATGRDLKRDGGTDLLSPQDKESADGLLAQLARYGVFAIQGGELESWLKDLGAPGHGPSWLVHVFDRIGQDPTAEGYLRPTDGDVWKFIGQVKQWLADPNRAGIPS
jgi:ABC-type branched-subunit amino acid transport system ATPase component